MSIFNNEVLAEIDKLTPPQYGKVQQVMLFTLIDSFISGGCEHEDEFVSDLKAFLGVE